MHGSKVIILGMGKSGLSVLKYVVSCGGFPICMDSSDRLLDGLQAEGFSVLRNNDPFPDNVDLVVRSPGIRKDHPWVKEALKKNIKLTVEMEIACENTANSGSLCLGITGTSGKTTTVLFTTHLLNVCGIRALAVGNIGIPFLDVCQRQDVDCFVIEMSSFQLEGFGNGHRCLSGAALLNCSPNHLDHHESLEDYRRSKLKILDHLLPGGVCHIGRGFDRDVDFSSRKIFDDFQQFLLDDSEVLSSVYSHDRDNYAVGYFLARSITDIKRSDLVEALQTFEKPPHRLELIHRCNEVLFINDSKSTTVNSVSTALSSIETPVFLILGGRNKGGDFSLLIPYLKNVKSILIMGEAQDEIAASLQGFCDVMRVSHLEEAVFQAADLAQPGDTVLLSPGCSSFDRFSDYQERGEVFKKLVFSLTGEKV